MYLGLRILENKIKSSDEVVFVFLYSKDIDIAKIALK